MAYKILLILSYIFLVLGAILFWSPSVGGGAEEIGTAILTIIFFLITLIMFIVALILNRLIPDGPSFWPSLAGIILSIAIPIYALVK